MLGFSGTGCLMRIILCADDFGYTPSVSKGILNLVEKKRLSAVSCLTNFPDWQMSAHRLASYRNQIDIGLHFNLTEGISLSENKKFPSLMQLMLTSHLRLVKRKWIYHELKRQYQRFVDIIGFAPDFIDGHQHIQHLPVIREVLLEFYQKQLGNHRPYLRVVNTNNSDKKSRVIGMTGASKFKKIVEAKKLPHPATFAGIYDFKNSQRYPEIFPDFLTKVEDGGLIMCHPASQTHLKNDPISAARWNEYQYFNDEKFERLLSDRKIELSRFQK